MDPRAPLFIGNWKRKNPLHSSSPDASSPIEYLDEPHLKRKSVILAQHPSIQLLYGSDRRSGWLGLLLVPLHLLVARYWTAWLIPPSCGSGLWTMIFLCVAYVVGGTCSQLLGILVHEGTHDLVFPCVRTDHTSHKGHEWLGSHTEKDTTMLHRLFCLYLNLGLPIPIAMSFRRYHLDHHAYQGVLGKDPDLPLEIESTLFPANRFYAKLLWLLIYPFMYGLRALQCSKRMDGWEILNLLFILAVDVLLYRWGGWQLLSYLFLSMYFGYSIHPAAAHFIQEHYTWTDGQETYSYYGRLNKLFLNIGFHNEHHDFTKIPWSRLPMLRKIAPEFYLSCYFHTSWYAVFWQFLTRDQLDPSSRLKRNLKAHWTGRKMMNPNDGNLSSSPSPSE